MPDPGFRPHQWLRECPPPWPRRDDDEDRPAPRRWERAREPFEDHGAHEAFPGALVMDDMVAADDQLTTLRVLARYTALRVLLLAVAGRLRGRKLRAEQRIALEHLALLPGHDWERRGLERLVMLSREQPAPEIVDAIVTAAEAAAKRAHVMGAFALYRAAWDLALARAWWADAARAAHGIAAIARLEEARFSFRLWRRRAAALDCRADRPAADTPPGA
jgi:hypothetical protein